MRKLIDVHCHLYEFPNDRINEILKDFKVVAVSDDYGSSIKTVKLAEEHEGILPCIGIHPWEVGKATKDEVKAIESLIGRYEVKGIGEVGLDKKFVKNTFNKQYEFFINFVNLAKEYDLFLNVHAPGAWREVLDLLRRKDVGRAVIHWFTGPLELLNEIKELGYFISLNPAAKVQNKHRRVIEEAPLNIILLESDGPYDYRGLKLEPKLIPELLTLISEIKKIDVDMLLSRINENFKALIKSV